ncbi:pilus assembly protein CpaF [Arcanobacterium wilhelmae]|uniref:Pilus assembly protein CpaF n=1 Tax=Arcanobacterium wilhelmae TaxID=1803177 RepID=A0ABT9NBJ8_9ACTO|nr:TadA family conjugal transfer-associated ATPase [Arcanobacterium wilhelmae]MDP9801087.1 pilus assembly protein CpaF [Arcanobacterium wilhelmae]WFN90443.1 TadA family conjugal transfer-associated ATPase [Arcanobacterium wilhelmae]
MKLSPAQMKTIRRRLAAGAPMSGALADVRAASTDELASLEVAVRHQIEGAGETIGPLLEDPAVTDVVVNGPGELWVDRGAGMEKMPATDPQLASEEGVRALAVRLAAGCGQRLDDASPIVDGTFPSGVRLHALVPPLAAEGTLISLRTHRTRKLTLEELVANGSVPAGFAVLSRALVAAKANAIISGATGSGKTTFLNAILQLVPPSERILVIEESAELAPSHPHVVHLQVRRANVQGVGEVTMSDLVRAAMRMRPDRIILGECRGGEVRDVLGALNTGHEGGWATIHANSAVDVPSRLTALGALAGMDEATVAAQAASALDAVIHVKRAGRRRFLAQIAVLERVRGELVAKEAFSVIRDGGGETGGCGAGGLSVAGGSGATGGVGVGRERVVAGPGAEKLCERLGIAVEEVTGR